MRLVKKPVLCNYYVTYRCNAKCGFCDIWEKPSPYITLEDVESNLTQLKKMGVKVIDFTGGEPLLHQKLPEFLSIAKRLGFITTITTNTLLYPKYAEQLKGKIDMLHFSLDSADKAKHDESRGVACYDFLMKSIEIAKLLGEKPDILLTIFEKNVHEIQEVYEKISLPNDLVLILNPIFDYAQIAKNDVLSNQTLNTLKKWVKKKKVYLNEAFLTLREDGGNHIDNPVCKAASATLVISPSNELIVPCYHLGEKKFPIEKKLEDVYYSKEVQKYVQLEGKLPECEGCVINCYMQPSFAVEINKYFWKALPSTLKYNFMKGTWRNLF